MDTDKTTAPIGEDRSGEGKVESLTSYLLTQGIVNLRLRAPVVVTARRGDPHGIRETYHFLEGDRQKLRVTFCDGLEAIYDGFWLRCQAEEVAG